MEGYNAPVISQLTIRRFKSVKDMTIPCRKVNLFVGAPDTGKTNILEALNLLSRLGWNWPLDTSLRLLGNQGFDPLFFRQFFDLPIEILTDKFSLRASIHGQDRSLKVDFPGYPDVEILFGGVHHIPTLDFIRFYAYTTSEHWQYTTSYPYATEVVTPPHGHNLMFLAKHNEPVYNHLKQLVSTQNWKLRFDFNTRRFSLSEVRQDEILDYNLELLSDSLKRLFFYGAILLTSKDATLVLDEPDVYAFPPYPKTLGEMIADDQSNQFFLTTHNPYFLSALLNKTPTTDLAVFVCTRDDQGATQAHLLTSEQVELMIEQGASVFFNLEDYLPQPLPLQKPRPSP